MDGIGGREVRNIPLIPDSPSLHRFVASLYNTSSRREYDAKVETAERCLHNFIDSRSLIPAYGIYILHDLLMMRRLKSAQELLIYLTSHEDEELFIGKKALEKCKLVICRDLASDSDIIVALYVIKSINYYMLKPKHNNAMHHFLHNSMISSFSSVVDLGCGTGWTGTYLRRAGYSGTIIGVDISGDMIDLARASGSYDVIVNDDIINYLGSSEQLFDMITMLWVAAHLSMEHLKSIINHASQRTKCGGLFIMDSIISHTHSCEDEDCGVFKVNSSNIMNELKNAGFAVRYRDYEGTRYFKCTKL